MVYPLKRKKRKFLKRIFRFVLILLLIVGGARMAFLRLFPMPYENEVMSAASQYGVSPALLYAVIKAESNFEETATSPRGAKGLMQLMDNTASWCAEKGNLPLQNIYAPDQNIALGAYYLAYLLEMYEGNEKSAVAAYNAGHGRVDNWLAQKEYAADGKELGIIPFAETEKYVKKITVYKKLYELRLDQKE